MNFSDLKQVISPITLETDLNKWDPYQYISTYKELSFFKDHNITNYGEADRLVSDKFNSYEELDWKGLFNLGSAFYALYVEFGEHYGTLAEMSFSYALYRCPDEEKWIIETALLKIFADKSKKDKLRIDNLMALFAVGVHNIKLILDKQRAHQVITQFCHIVEDVFNHHDMIPENLTLGGWLNVNGIALVWAQYNQK